MCVPINGRRCNRNCLWVAVGLGMIAHENHRGPSPGILIEDKQSYLQYIAHSPAQFFLFTLAHFFRHGSRQLQPYMPMSEWRDVADPLHFHSPESGL